jgi:MoaA/NifB/PqqE/SkfB family radical SAM enzyme
VFIEVIMRCLFIRCARCQKDDTEGVLDEINKVCAEFGIKHGVVRLTSVAQAVISGRRAQQLKPEEKEVAKQVALRLLTMMTDAHYCEFCREKVAEKEKREALRQKFKVIIGKKD